MRYTITVFLFLFSILPFARAGNDPRVKCLGIGQGLSNKAVTCVYQDA